MRSGMVTDPAVSLGQADSHTGLICQQVREITVLVLWTLRGILRITGTLPRALERTESSADVQCSTNSLIIQRAFLVRGSWIQSPQKMCTWARQSGSGAPGHLDTVLNRDLGEKIELDNWILGWRVVCVSLHVECDT